jgi:hypothetical protein
LQKEGNQIASVEDFNWIKREQSPNWRFSDNNDLVDRILAELERGETGDNHIQFVLDTLAGL